MGEIIIKQKRNAISNEVRFKATMVIRDMKNKSNCPIIVEYAKDDYLSHSGFNIYLVQGDNRTWIDASKSENTAVKKVNELYRCVS